MAYPSITVASANIGTDASNASSVGVTVPATSADGHTQVLLIACRSQSSTPTFSTSGWESVGSVQTTMPLGALRVYKRVGTYSSGTTTITLSVATAGRVHALAVTGALDASAFTQNSSYISTATTPTVTATGAETVWVQGVATAEYPRVLGKPSDTTALTDLSAHSYIIGFGLASKQVGSGATGASGNWTLFDTESPTTPATDAWMSTSLAFSTSGTSPTLSGEDTLPEAPVITGALTATLGAATLSSASTAPRVGNLTATLGAATLSSTGTSILSGNLTATLGAATLTSAGVVPVVGELSATLGAATLEASDLASARGALDVTLGAATLSATATAVLVERTGVLNVTFGGISLSSAGTLGSYPLERPFIATVVDNSLVATVVAADLSRTVRAVELQATVMQ